MEKPFSFDLREFAGAIGDYGTLLPIVIGVAVVTEMQLSSVLFFFGLAYIITGLYYRLPIPVEPMKAIGAIAIGGSLTSLEIVGAGFLTGVLLLLTAFVGGMDKIKDLVPQPVVRGIQLTLTLTFFSTAFSFLGKDPLIGTISMVIVVFFSFMPLLDISSLVILALGLGIGIYSNGFPGYYSFQWPKLMIPTILDLRWGFLHGTLPQLPMTFGNSVLATSLLVYDLFQKRIPERKLALSVGLMCVLASPFGGFPMCHGAGGLAAQYRFGARTGGSNIISGVFLLVVAFFFASPEIIHLIPFGVLGALLFFSGFQMIKSVVKTKNYWITALTGLFGLYHLALAFLFMVLIYWVSERITGKRTMIGDRGSNHQ